MEKPRPIRLVAKKSKFEVQIYNVKNKQVWIHVIQAKNVRSDSDNGKIEGYVGIFLNGRFKQTKTVS